ncbi:hypothetical protein Hanom_Chr10g00891861 [Helianthus anomalus]
MKETSAADELKTLEGFKNTRSKCFLKDEKEKKKRGGKRTPKDQAEEGSSSQPKPKCQKKVVETLLVDEPEEEEPEAEVEGDHVRLSPESDCLLKDLNKSFKTDEAAKAADKEGGNEEESSSSSKEEVDETERYKKVMSDLEKEKQKKRKRSGKNDDGVYVPSPDHVQETQTPPSSGGWKKTSARKCSTPPQQPSPPHLSLPHHSPPHQSPPHLSQLHIVTPPHEQPVVTSQQIFQPPPSSQPQVQTTPGSSSFKDFPHVSVNIGLEDIRDLNFANDEQVKKLEKKVEEVLVENKKLVDREKKLEKRVKTVEAENLSLLKRLEADQTEIDIMKVCITDLEEKKAQRDE